jgi:hypothetical protein
MAKILALVPSMTSFGSPLLATRRCQEAEEPAAGCVKRTLLVFHLMMRK